MRYVDVGASHPVTLSNTYALYRLGARGVLVEPDPDLAQLLRKVRPRDVVIAAGAAFDERRSATLYRLTTRSYNTFLRDHADATVAGQREKIEDAVNIPLIPLNEIISGHPPAPHVLSIDAEGVDLEILKSLNLDLLAHDWGPCFICVEGSVTECWRIFEPAGFEVMARLPTNWIFMRAPRA